MLLNYLKIALRTMLRYKSFSIINVVGLTLGLTAFLGISLYVADEMSYDNFHVNKDRIYRGVSTFGSGNESRKMGSTPNKLATTAVKEIPEVEKAARYFHHNFGDLAFISRDTENFSEPNLFYADPELFDILTFSFVKGNATELAKPGVVVISQTAAQKYFGESDPMGQTLMVDGNLQLEVTGVYKDLPSNSSLSPALIASFSSNWFGQERTQSWSNASFDSFFLLHEGVSQQAAEEKITAMVERNVPADQRRSTITLQPLLDIRLHSGDFDPSDRRQYGDLKQVKILTALASIILIIAAVNYMNLSTAQSQRRNKEVGITKTLGATFFQLTRRFYIEASVFVLVSLLVSLALFSILLPTFNQLSGKAITMSFASSGVFWIGFAAVWFVLTLMAGLYPALYLSSFSPKLALQKLTPSGGQAFIRKGLVVFQFSISIILIICSVVFYKQMMYIRDKKLGYEPEQVLAITTAPAKDRDQVLAVKTAYEGLTDVVQVARSQSYPGNYASGRAIYKPGDEEGTPIQTVRATHEALGVLNIKLLAGTTLPETKDPADTTTQLVVNRATVDYLGLTPEQAIGQRVSVMGFGQVTEIVGVVENFHFNSLHQAIKPFCFHNTNQSEPLRYLLVKVNTGNLTATLKQLENTYQKNINASFEYLFLDEHLNTLYRSEQNLSKVVLVFAGLAIFVACLGLYALAAFTTEQRTKEIGIRKVLGASVTNVISLLSRDFMTLVLIAFVIGIPAGYYMMDKWLQAFAYRTDITVVVFIAAGLISMLIAGATVSVESLRAARTNPVKSLRSE